MQCENQESSKNRRIRGFHRELYHWVGELPNEIKGLSLWEHKFIVTLSKRPKVWGRLGPNVFFRPFSERGIWQFLCACLEHKFIVTLSERVKVWGWLPFSASVRFFEEFLRVLSPSCTCSSALSGSTILHLRALLSRTSCAHALLVGAGAKPSSCCRSIIVII